MPLRGSRRLPRRSGSVPSGHRIVAHSKRIQPRRETENSIKIADADNVSNRTIRELAIPILVALVAVAGTCVGVLITADAGEKSQGRQISEERAKAEREKRAEIYFRFMTDSQSYYRRQSQDVESCAPGGNGTKPSDMQLTTLVRCLLDDPKLAELADPLTKSRNELYVYGSDRANHFADLMIQTFPLIVHPVNFRHRSVVTFNDQIRLGIDFEVNYVEFRTVACGELPPNPRPKC